MDKDIMKTIIERIPQQAPFRFVDQIESVDENHIRGSYQFRSDEFFYKGHFPGQPITPGAILLETLAQIGLVGLGIYLLGIDTDLGSKYDPVFTSAEVEFYNVVLPGEKVWVSSTKQYFRLNKLKCKMEMRSGNGKLKCAGTLSGMFIEKVRTIQP